MGSAQSAVGWARHGVTEPAGPTAPGGRGLSRWSPAASGFASRGHSRDGRAQKRGRAPWVSNSAQASLSSMKIIRACCSYGCPAACGSSGEGGWCLRPAWPRPAPVRPPGAHLVRVDNQHGPAILLLHLPGRHQVGHAHGSPAALAVPQHGVQRGQQGADVPLLALGPLQELRDRRALQTRVPAAAPPRRWPADPTVC